MDRGRQLENTERGGERDERNDGMVESSFMDNSLRNVYDLDEIAGKVDSKNSEPRKPNKQEKKHNRTFIDRPWGKSIRKPTKGKSQTTSSIFGRRHLEKTGKNTVVPLSYYSIFPDSSHPLHRTDSTSATLDFQEPGCIGKEMFEIQTMEKGRVSPTRTFGTFF